MWQALYSLTLLTHRAMAQMLWPCVYVCARVLVQGIIGVYLSVV